MMCKNFKYCMLVFSFVTAIKNNMVAQTNHPNLFSLLPASQTGIDFKNEIF
jgi:hypothetical protein